MFTSATEYIISVDWQPSCRWCPPILLQRCKFYCRCNRGFMDFVTSVHLSISHRVDIFSFTACRVDMGLMPTLGTCGFLRL